MIGLAGVPLSEEQQALRSVAADVLGRVWTPDQLRKAWEGDRGHSEQLWNALRGAGLTAIAVPQSHGGLGMREPELVLVAAEAGRAALTEPLLATGLAALVIEEHGSRQQRDRWLAALAAGEAIGVLAVDGAALVPDADVADVVVVTRGTEVHVVPADRVGMTRRRSIDRARRLFSIDFAPHPETMAIDSADAVGRIEDQAAVITAATLCGISSHLLERTLEYVKLRSQFGRPVGSFQAVKHRLADAFVAVEMSFPPCLAAARSLAEHRASASIDVSVAKANASDAAAVVNNHALQCHGAVGYSWEHDLHLWLKRGKALEQEHGNGRFHRTRIGRYLMSEAIEVIGAPSATALLWPTCRQDPGARLEMTSDVDRTIPPKTANDRSAASCMFCSSAAHASSTIRVL
jgi:alkylation response protein AidB-like acyl-CoA dehydrogenase